MKKLLLILVLLLSGCAVTFQPNGQKGKQIEYFWGKKICDYCHKETGFFKVVNKKKIMCADCYEKKIND